jgi:hypothetical protein
VIAAPRDETKLKRFARRGGDVGAVWFLTLLWGLEIAVGWLGFAGQLEPP